YFALARRGDSRPRRRGWLAFAALTLPYLPLAAWEVRFVLGDSTTWHQPIAPLDFLRVSFTKFAANRADPASEARARWPYLALAPLALVALLATAWVPLRDVNLAAQPEKEDWREAYAVVAEHLHPRDLVLVHPGYLVSTLDYYRLQQPDSGPRSLRDVPALTI